MRAGVLVAMLGAVALSGCATTAPPPTIALRPGPPAITPSPSRPPLQPPSPPTLAVDAFASLDGWAGDDHLADFNAFRASCGLAKDEPTRAVCARALASGPMDENGARAFLERNFRPEPFSEVGLLTAYFTPIYEARSRREGEFTAPVRPRPPDLPSAGPDGRLAAAYPDRAEIEARPAPDALAWMRPEDLFFMQIQGSGILTFADGQTLRAAYDGANGAPFAGIAAPMRQQGLLPDQDTSADRIRAWLASHRGPQAQAVMSLDRRYVFFRLEPDDGVEPSGAAGLRLIPGRAVAVDPSLHAMGEVLWLDAKAPALAGAFPAYHRLALALDTGSAIKGEGRADLYIGRGPDAGLEAGRVRHQLHMYRLLPVAQPDS